MDRQQLDEIDARVATRLASGDLRGAATAALRSHGPQILGYLVNLVGDEHLAHEAFAQFSEELWKSLPGFDGRSRFRTWAYTLASRTAYRVRGDAFRRRARPLDDAGISALAEKVRSETALQLKTETRRGIGELRAALSAEDQRLLFLRIDQGLSWKEVAEVLSQDGRPVNEARLRKRFERVKQTLREQARARGLLQPR